MSQKKIKIQQFQKQQIKELERLKTRACNLEERIRIQKKENFKQLNIRNLKIFEKTLNLLAPFAIVTGITVGSFRLCGGGLPFHTDEIVKYKNCNLDYKTGSYVTMDVSYITRRWFDDTIPENKLTIYTPWEYVDNKYIRYKREYNIKKLNRLDLFDAVFEENYIYLEENELEYKEEKQTTNYLESTEEEYIFEASLHMLDKEDILKYDETQKQNIIITIGELIFSLGLVEHLHTTGNLIIHMK